MANEVGRIRGVGWGEKGAGSEVKVRVRYRR